MKKLTAAILSACLLSAAVSSVPDQTFAAKTKGDINGDGKVNSTDLLSALKYLTGASANTDISSLDMNGDGKINIIDFIDLKTKIVPEAKPETSDFEIKNGVLLKYNGTDEIVKIPETVTEIAERAFWSNRNIVAVYIPGTVKKVGDSAFWSCDALEFLDIAEGVEHIGDSLTWSCPSLKDVNLPSTIKLSADLSEGQLNIFANCPKLKIHLSESAKGKNTDSEKIAKNSKQASESWADTPYDFKPVTYVPADRSKMIVPGAYEYGKFSEFTIPEGTTEIGARAFQYCKQLKSIIIPGSVKSIGVDAFEYCESLTDVYISEGCETLEYGSFAYCKTLKNVTLPASITSIHKGAFDHSKDSLTIHCPKGSYAEKYANENKIKHDNNVSGKPETPAVTTTPAVTAPAVTKVTQPVTASGTEITTTAPVTTVKSETTTTAAVTTVSAAAVTAPGVTTQAVTTTAVSAAKPFSIKTAAKFAVTSKNLNGGVWDDVISNTSRGKNASPELSWAPVENASCYAIYMIDTSAGNWMHWKSNGIKETSLKQGYAKRNEYVGPYPPSGTHTYQIYVFALKDPVSSMQGNFDDENAGIETLAKSLDKTSSGEVGNIISYGHISGKFSH
ncbi:leucine-rich repeat protein [Ruminococcus sp. HUN007]|uniref:leucine-rich repeat protein n=1 Tax=Ruminococcus sp. HUN007 TaxID=1514668 RepID=UPI0009DF7CB8|nr:leucine-rich repeat protein [Ruminococcus sp. HUN007]